MIGSLRLQPVLAAGLVLVLALCLLPPAGAAPLPLPNAAEDDACAAVPAALRPACAAASTLLTYYRPLVGGFEDTAFWGTANSLTALTDFCRGCGGLARCPFNTTITDMVRLRPAAAILLEAAGSNDDALWWCLAMLDIYELSGNAQALSTATAIFEFVWKQAWDSTCGGGLWWSERKSYKNAVTNELCVDASVRLHLASPGNPSFLARARLVTDWFLSSGLLNEHGMVDDGLTSACKSNGDPSNPYSGWTYNQAVIAGGLLRMANATGNATLLDTAVRIANTTITHRVTAGGVLSEVRIDNRDGQQFKGIFARYLAQLVAGLPAGQEAARSRFSAFLAQNRASLVANDQGTSGAAVFYGALWQGPVNASAPCGSSKDPADPLHCVGPTPQTAALDLLNSEVYGL